MTHSELDIDSEPLSPDDFADALEGIAGDLREMAELMTVDDFHDWFQRKLRYELGL